MLSRKVLVGAVGLLTILTVGQPIGHPQVTLVAGTVYGAGLPPGQTRVSIPGGSYIDVSPLRLRDLLRHKRFALVNVHVPYAGEIVGTDRFIPFDQIDRNLTRFPARTAMVVLYCRSGRMSVIAARRLVHLGYQNIWELAGGMDAWQKQGLRLRQVLAHDR